MTDSPAFATGGKLAASALVVVGNGDRECYCGPREVELKVEFAGGEAMARAIRDGLRAGRVCLPSVQSRAVPRLTSPNALSILERWRRSARTED